MCACSPAVVGSEALCPVKVAKKLYDAALRHGPVGAHPIPGMRPLWPSVEGKFVSKRACYDDFPERGTRVGSQVH